MEHHFKSVLMLVESPARESECRELLVDYSSSSVSLQPVVSEAAPGRAGTTTEPHPHLAATFNQVISSSTETELYTKHVKDVVESVLLGYHGTVISFGPLACTPNRIESLEAKGGLIHKSAMQILRCLKRSGKSDTKSKSSPYTNHLVILGSYIILLDEQARDLLSDFSLPDDAQRSVASRAVPVLRERENETVNASSHVLSSSHCLKAMLKHGSEKIQQICPNPTRRYHTIFSLSVEYKQFGTVNVPISGNLSFVNISPTDSLIQRNQALTGVKAAPETSTLSLFTFADAIEAFARKSAMSVEETDLYASAIHVSPSEVCSQSLLTRCLSESLGGNCKTIFMTYFPSAVPSSFSNEDFQTLALASQARLIENKPNKRELAEKALMSAYMKGLEEMYGQGVKAKDDSVKKERSKVANEAMLDKNVYRDMLKATSEDTRQHSMELAATALVAAALKDKETPLVEQGVDDSYDTSDDEGSTTSLHNSRSESQSSLSKEWSGTLSSLAKELEDQDSGVKRISDPQVLHHVKIDRGAGALFSGESIVDWLKNLHGVETEEEATKLGQMLIDSGNIFHTEGSQVFAKSTSLFYHVAKKEIKKKEIPVDPVGKEVVEKGAVEEVEDMSLSNENAVAEAESFGEVELEEFKEDPDSDSHGDSNPEEDAVGELSSTAEEEQAEVLTTDPDVAAMKKWPTLDLMKKYNDYPHPLHMASCLGKSPGVLRELIMMFGVDKRDNKDRTPLMFAALGNIKNSCCLTLIKSNATVDLQDDNDFTALHIACCNGNKSAVNVLLANKASLSLEDKQKHTAFHWAMVPEDVSSLKLLSHYLKQPDLVHQPASNGLTPLHWGIYFNRPEHVKMLLKLNPSMHRLSALDDEGRTLATYAVEKQSPACLTVLLKAEPLLLTTPDHQGSNPLHHASVQPDLACFHTLLLFKPPRNFNSPTLDVNALNSYQRSPLHCTAAYGNLEAAITLINAGALTDIRDMDDKTPLDYVQELENSETKKNLLHLFLDTGNASDVQQENETVCPSLERSTGSSPTNEVSKFTGDEVSSRDKEGTKMKSGFCSLL